MNYETPQIGSEDENNYGPLTQDERHKLADMRLKEIFVIYAK
jgi:hypothetical protein